MAIDAETKLVPSFLVADRSAGAAYDFTQDVASLLRSRVQLTTDGHKLYLAAVEDAFGADIVAAVTLHFMHYNFVRMYKALRMTPALAAGVPDHVWSIEEVVGLMS